jgi:hypothetical protein
MRVRFTSTVFGLRNRRSAISRLVRPVTASRAILSSVVVSPVAVKRCGIRASSARARSAHTGVPRLSNAASALTGSEWFKSGVATCPAGTTLLGGGGQVVGDGHEVRLTSLVPAAAGFPPDSYFATAMEDGSYAGNWSLSVWALCGTDIHGWQVVTTSASAIPGSTLTGVVATCPADKKVIGTGAAASGGFPYLIDSIEPDLALTSVFVKIAGDETTPIAGSVWGATAYAICVLPVPGQQLVTASTAVTSDDKSVSATCPSGTFLQTAAGSLTNAPGEAFLAPVSPNGPSQVTVVAREDETGQDGTWSLTAFGVCAHRPAPAT